MKCIVFNGSEIPALREIINSSCFYIVPIVFHQRFTDEVQLLTHHFTLRIFEETEKNVPDYDWKSFRYITKNGQVVCAYSYKDYEKLKTVAFARGINDKFDVNLNVETYLDEFGIDA